MAQDTAPAASEILAVLRAIRRCHSAELAAASGLTLRSLHAYEWGERQPDASTMRRLAAALGFPAAVLDRTAAFFERTRASLADVDALAAAAAAAPGAAPAPIAAEARQTRIARIAAEAGQWFEDLARSGLHGALLGAPAAEPPRAFPPRSASPPPRSVEAARPVPEALTILRLVRRLSQTELGALSGVKPASISAYERARVAPKPEIVRRLVEALGFTVASLDRALAFVEAVRATAAAPDLPAAAGAGPDLAPIAAALDAQIDRLARDEGRAVEDFARARLHGLALKIRVLASRQAAPALWQRLAGRPPAEQRRLVDGDPAFHTSGLCERLCEESVRAAGDSAARAVQLAELALRVAERVVDDEGFQARLRGYALKHLTNAVRVAGDLPAAERTLQRAAEPWQAGAASDPGLLNEARVLGFEASLRRDQRRLQDSLVLLDRALALDAWGETTFLMISKAKTLEELGDFAAAIDLLRQAASRPDARLEPRLLLSIRTNLAVNLCHLGRHAEARLALSEVRSLAEGIGKRLDLLRVRWLEGRVAAGLDRPEEALAILEEVRGEFLSRGIAYDAALATIELAEVHAALGHSAQVKALARESAPVFVAQGVHREAQRALECFRAAAEAERLPLHLVRAIITYLQRARQDPQLRFEAAA